MGIREPKTGTREPFGTGAGAWQPPINFGKVRTPMALPWLGNYKKLTETHGIGPFVFVLWLLVFIFSILFEWTTAVVVSWLTLHGKTKKYRLFFGSISIVLWLALRGQAIPWLLPLTKLLTPSPVFCSFSWTLSARKSYFNSRSLIRCSSSLFFSLICACFFTMVCWSRFWNMRCFSLYRQILIVIEFFSCKSWCSRFLFRSSAYLSSSSFLATSQK